MFFRVEMAIRPEFPDPGADQMLRKIELALPEVRRKIRWARMLDVYWMEVLSPREQIIPSITEIFWDPVLTWLFSGDLIPSAAGPKGGMADLFDAAPFRSGTFWGLEKRFRPGVTDNVGRTAIEAFEIVLGEKLERAHASSGKLLLIEGDRIEEEEISAAAREVFCNELIESWTLRTADELKKFDRFHPDNVKWELPKVSMKGKADVETVDLNGLSKTALEDMSRERLWALTGEEMKAVQSYYAESKTKSAREKAGLGAPTDVEMEVIAQTWSEHCKHKIFNAEISYKENVSEKHGIPSKVQSLFKETISAVTRDLPRPWLISVFSDNAGIVDFDGEDAVCIKVETHNSPSALDPYGGSLTGIVGVNRDILGCGRGARPIFNTDVFCLAVPDYQQKIPDRLLHPRRILSGVRSGVEDGGNKSGIPTVNGALVFDSRYLGKPLIYCGTGGIMPRESAGMKCEDKSIELGDLICMVGGRIGKDGIHGATFSSLALDEKSPVTAVQLGDPITQKRAADFLLEARELGLYRTLTDNGAGGLSSSVGELAEISGGAKMDVAKAKTKYPGLKPFELVVSESQERMTVVVPPDQHVEFLKLAARRGVEVSTLGEFNDTGFFEICYEGETVALLDLEFLHGGIPKMKLSGEWTDQYPKVGNVTQNFEAEFPNTLSELLSRPNISSKEWLIRQYDHEVQGTSVVKPLHTVDAGTENEASGPNDASVLKPKKDSYRGVTIGCGIRPKLSDIDPFLMAQYSVDEAIRNVLCAGTEYGTKSSVLALCDNFCWPDPVGDSRLTAALVRACYGMREAALALGTPFVSGKDSMKNDYRGRRDGKEIKISVPPTLLITAMGQMADIREARTSDFKAAGDRIYLLGGSLLSLYGSELHWHLVERLEEKGGHSDQVVLPRTEQAPNSKKDDPKIARPNWSEARRIYRWLGGAEGELQATIKSLHDVSEGGLLCSVAESMIARGLGARIQVPRTWDAWEFCFGEGFHSFVATVASVDADAIEEQWRNYEVPFLPIGEVTSTGELVIERGTDKEILSSKMPISEIRKAWKREGYWE